MAGFGFEPSNSSERRQLRRYYDKLGMLLSQRHGEMSDDDWERLVVCSTAMVEAYALGSHTTLKVAPDKQCPMLVSMAEELAMADGPKSDDLLMCARELRESAMENVLCDGQDAQAESASDDVDERSEDGEA